MVIYIGLYLFIGLIVLCATIFIHLFLAEYRGYDATDWWYNYTVSHASNGHNYARRLKMLWGMIIWPVRIIRFVIDTKKYYKNYELK